MPRTRLWLLTLLLIASLWPDPVSARVFKGFPDVIVCRLPASAARPVPADVVLYVDARDEGGPVIYKPLGQSAIIVEIGEDGVVRAPRLKGCDGLTLEELREQGRAFDYR